MKIHILWIPLLIILSIGIYKALNPCYASIPVSTPLYIKADTSLEMKGSMDGIHYFLVRNDSIIYSGEYKDLIFTK